MIIRAGNAALLALSLLIAPRPSIAAEVTLLISNAVKTVMEDLAPRFEQATGHKLLITYGSTNPLKARIDKGDAFDMTILGESAVDDLIKAGKLDGASRSVVARSGMGVAIRKGAPKPDMSTTDAFKRTMLAAKSIAYQEDGLTGTYLKTLFARLGIAEAMKPKYRNTRGGEAVAAGEVEYGVMQISEVLYQEGADFAGPLPPEIQNYTNFPAAVSSNARQTETAKAVIKYFASRESVALMKKIGLEPPQ